MVALLAACSATKFVPDESYLLEKVELKADTKKFNVASLEPYIRQKANSKWFSVFKIPLGTYALSGRDTTRWINRTLRKIGEEPVVYDTLQAQLSCNDLKLALQNMGYMNAEVDLTTRAKGKRLTAIYTLHPGTPFFINSVRYDIQDSVIARMLDLGNPDRQELKAGDPFTVTRLEEERKRITRILMDSGYYRFHKDFIQYGADSTAGQNQINLMLHLLPYRPNSAAPETLHPRYSIRNVTFSSNDSAKIHLRPRVLRRSTLIKEGDLFSATQLQRTYANFARMQAVRYTNIRFTEAPDTTLLDCDINISTNKPSSISFQPEGTNTAGDLGAAASVTYENRNLFRGSELLSIQLRAAYEAITGLEGYQNKDYQEYGVETKLTFPRFVAPLLSRSFRRRSIATSELSLNWNLQNRPEFHRRVFSTAWRYHWNEPRHHISYRYDFFDINYVYMPWISSRFKADYLDNVTSRNAILRYNYEDLFILKMGFGLAFNDGENALKVNVESAGNMLHAVSKMFRLPQNADGKYTLVNIAYAQYVKFDVDFTRLFQFDERNSLAFHVGLGVAYPYGNSTILPFEKRYFSGGANSVRGWRVRELGPGTFKGTDGRIDFINQTGDMKLDMNLEYRTFLGWKLHGAVFVDAGNIWTLRNYADQPGGQFRFNSFYRQIALAYGLGLRLNFDYFILRFDLGMKAVNPAYETSREHYPLLYPNFKRDFAFHFAVGLPF
ncbi:translocation and assembly module lipoprotein TamL [Hoylesella loescheii]|jgi:surface antigen|uniref:Outer membrane protein, OMP85 family n=1 Tax=Hoylesella loescheii DSM 19665 = JCM 12249 = ATCC 15930 TaxID=1122985 RepID=A0A069QU00_HOYLO|nr:BamA/TamA family outer membrane protein [Hoylesella loescheii]KDR53346.1 outer membrane protein, OMP85 family [Hoylesella loescheii DSM 19665 = JCM 12249 = ATCC 15930]